VRGALALFSRRAKKQLSEAALPDGLEQGGCCHPGGERGRHRRLKEGQEVAVYFSITFICGGLEESRTQSAFALFSQLARLQLLAVSGRAWIREGYIIGAAKS
jgi:hypothetical protein